MRIFNRYLFFLVLAASFINVSLSIMGQKDLTLYFTVNIIAYLIITLLHVYLNPGARRVLGGVTIVLFSGFILIVIIKTTAILFNR